MQDRTQLEGGRDWWEQLKELLQSAEYLVLVMTSAALASSTVRREWRFARQQGVCVYPVIADPVIRFDALPRWMRSVHWYDIEHEEDKLYQDLTVRCRIRRVPFMVEDLPAHFVMRDEHFATLKATLLSSDREEPVAITAALRGAGGFGKTTLARALCHDEDIQNAFDDGILWVTLGEAPSPTTLTAKVTDLIETLGGGRPGFEGLDAAATRLREELADRDILLVIDDVWRAADLRPFLSGGDRCARLITTRRGETLPDVVHRIAVDQMEPAQALQLLGQGLPVGHEDLLQGLSRQLGEWPLLLKAANAMLRKRIGEMRQAPEQALRALQALLSKRGVTAFDPQSAQQREDAASRTLDLSFDGLSPDLQWRLLELAVFAEDEAIPLRVLERYWLHTAGLDESDVELTCQRLFDESMVLQCDLEQRFLTLHDAIRSWLIARQAGQALAHQHDQLLTAYASGRPRWCGVVDDGYLYQHLAPHLIAAGRGDELRALLVDADWIAARLATDSSAGHPLDAAANLRHLLADYARLAPDVDVGLVEQALRMSAHVLSKRPDLLAQQLIGRLGAVNRAGLEPLLEQLREVPSGLRSLRPTLTPPGPLTLTLTGHGFAVEGVEVSPDGRIAVSWALDVLRVWDLESGVNTYALRGHGRWISGAALLRDSQQLLSWSMDGTLLLWNIADGRLLRRFEGHKGELLGALVLPDTRRVLSWARDRRLMMWDLDTGGALWAVDAHHDTVMGVLLHPDQRRAISWSWDGLIKAWDIDSGAATGRGLAFMTPVLGALLADSRHLVAWSKGGTLQIWDLESHDGDLSLEGHEGSINGALVLDADLLTWGNDDSLRRWHWPSGRLLKTLRSAGVGASSVLPLQGRRQVISWGENKRAALWDLDRDEPLLRLAQHPGRGAFGVLGGGLRAVSLRDDGVLKLWDLTGGENLWTVAGHASQPGGHCGLTLLPDGHRALTWARDGLLKVWDMDVPVSGSGSGDHPSAVRRLCDSALGRRVLSHARDTAPLLWDAEIGAVVGSLKCGDSDGVLGVTPLPDGDRLVTWSSHGRISVWSGKTASCLVNVVAGMGELQGVVPAGTNDHILAWDESRVLTLWNIASGVRLQHISTGHDEWISGAVGFNQGLNALTWSSDGWIKLWDLEHGNLVRKFSRQRRSKQAVTVLGDGAHAVWVDGAALVWSGERSGAFAFGGGEPLGVIEVGDRLLTWSSDGRLALVRPIRGHAVDPDREWTAHEGAVLGASLFDAGRRALSWSLDGTFALWDLQSGDLIRRLHGHLDAVAGVLLLGDEKRAVSRSDDRTVRLWDLSNGNELASYVCDATPTCMTLALGERRLFVGDALGHVHVFAL